MRDAQTRDLRGEGFDVPVSSVNVSKREKLAKALDHIRDDGTLIVTRLNPLAAFVPHRLAILVKLQSTDGDGSVEGLRVPIKRRFG